MISIGIVGNGKKAVFIGLIKKIKIFLFHLAGVKFFIRLCMAKGK